MDSILVIENLKVSYGNFVAFSTNHKIEFKAGDRIGIIGNNGAGKTTFVKAVCGFLNYNGTINYSIGKNDMSLHLQDNQYVKRMTVKIIIEAIFNTAIAKNEKLQGIIKFFDFESCLKKRFAQLSGGQKQRLTIILILMQDKPLTFFDEVTSGLDFETRGKLMTKIHEWYAGKNSTVCVVSHYYDELENFVNKLLIIHEGKVVDFGNVDELFKKYCSPVVYIIDRTEKNERLTKDFNRLHSPAHLLAFASSSLKDEKKLTDLFVREDINFKRRNKDLEILFSNAIAEGAE